jgi:hypothetical protein
MCYDHMFFGLIANVPTFDDSCCDIVNHVGAARVSFGGDDGSAPDLHLIKQVEQVAGLALEGPARQYGDGSEQ